MKKIFPIIISIAIIGCNSPQDLPDEKTLPNIIVFLADDLGYGEIGLYGQEKIETPNLDKLGNEGMVFTQFYSGSPVCAPARCVLLTGYHSGHSSIRGNHEWGERGDVWNFTKAVDDPNFEGQYPMPDSTKTIADYLKSVGYATGMVGKWGLGGPLSHSIPTKMGFDYFYGYNCQRQAHTYYPAHLWENDKKVKLNNKVVPPGTGLAEGADVYNDSSYRSYQLTDYAPDLMHEKALKFIEDNREKPFFLYYASPIPHLPLQSNSELVKYYQEKFGEEEPYTGKSYFPNRTPRATYAAMVGTIDIQIGDIVQKLEELGLSENTLIIFTSDNGPSYTGGTDSPWFNSGGPFKSEYGWGKGFLKEGGIRVPMIARWPSSIKPGGKSEVIGSFQDIIPTVASYTGMEFPTFLDGESLASAMEGNPNQVHEYLYWEFPAYGGQQAVRMGKWKAHVQNLLKEEQETILELYNLEEDIQELTNLADSFPEITTKMREILKKEHIKSSIDRFVIPEIDN